MLFRRNILIVLCFSLGLWFSLLSATSYSENIFDNEPTTAQECYDRAQKLLDSYQGYGSLIKGALGLFYKAVQLDEKFFPAYIGIANCLLDISYLSGDNYDIEAGLDLASNYIDKAQQLAPENPQVYFIKGQISFAYKNSDQAIDELNKAIKLDPVNSSYYAWLARVYKNKKDYAKAKEMVDKALSLNPTKAKDYLFIADVYEEMHEYDLSIETFKKGIAIAPNFSWLWNNYGSLLLNLGKYDEAIEALETAVKLMNYKAAHHNLGQAYMAKGRYEEAEKEFIKIDDKESLSGLYAKMGKSEQQMNIINQRPQDDNWALIEKARLAGKNGEIEQAFSYYKQALNIKPENALIYHDMGQLYKNIGKGNEAIEMYNKAIEIDPMMSIAYYDLGIMYDDDRFANLSNPQKAIEYLKKSVNLNPYYSDAYYSLARAYENIDDRSNSIPNFEKYLELAPNGNFADFVRGYLKRIKK